MPLNNFQFEPVKQPDRVGEPELPDEDPRNDPFYAHSGYSVVIPKEGPRQYEHEHTGRRMTSEQYRNETAMIDRKMDVHYGDDDDE